MNKRRIIFSSISVILLMALVGGTLAWFYVNEEVAVDYGSSIFCEAGDSLEISLVENGAASRWTSAIDYRAGEFTTVDISGNGIDLYRPAEINEYQQPDGFINAVSSLENSIAYDYIELEVAFRSLSKMNVYLSEASFIEPVETESDGSNIYGNFSRDYIAGAMRVAVIEDNDLRLLWAPNSQYELIDNGDGTYNFLSGAAATPEENYSYFMPDGFGDYIETEISAKEYATNQFVVDSTGASRNTTGKSPVLVSLDPASEGEYAQKTVRVRIWFEGTDREAHQALAGGNVNAKLKFVGVYKETDEEKQAAIDSITFDQENGTFQGVQKDMLFSIDGRNWTMVNSAVSNLPVLQSGSSIFFKYPETGESYETTCAMFTKD